VPRASGHRGVVGRTLTAVYATISDVDEALSVAPYSNAGLASVGGLRGGFARDDYPRTRLHRYSYVPGVRVSGRIAGVLHQHGTLRIGAAAQAGAASVHASRAAR
jgi:hypothetical protein